MPKKQRKKKCEKTSRCVSDDLSERILGKVISRFPRPITNRAQEIMLPRMREFFVQDTVTDFLNQLFLDAYFLGLLNRLEEAIQFSRRGQ